MEGEEDEGDAGPEVSKKKELINKVKVMARMRRNMSRPDLRRRVKKET